MPENEMLLTRQNPPSNNRFTARGQDSGNGALVGSAWAIATNQVAKSDFEVHDLNCCWRRRIALIRRRAKPSCMKSAEKKMRRCHATNLFGRF